MGKNQPKFPASVGEKMQYMTHTGNDSSTRFVLHYPGQINLKLLRQAMRQLIDRVFVLHSSFIDGDIPYWVVNDDYTSADTVKQVTIEAGGDVLAAAEAEALRPVYFDDTFQIYCALADNGSESAIALVISHLVADGGDAKYILSKLVELYNCLAAGADPDRVEIKNGDRDLLQVFDNVDPDVLENRPEEDDGGNVSKTRTEFQFPEPDDVGTARIIRRTITAEALAPARKKAKAQNATVNDLILAAYYRATAKYYGYSPVVPMSFMSMIDLRQYMEEGTSEGICNLSSVLPTALTNGIGNSFSETLEQITYQTKATKENGMAGFYNMDMGRTVAKTVFNIPFRILKFVGRVGTRVLPMGMTNLGNISSSALELDGMAPNFAYFAGQVKKKPGMQMAVMSMDGSPTLTIANICGDHDAVALSRLLELVEQEITAFGED